MDTPPTRVVLADGGEEWRLANGLRHRTDGPALTQPNGAEYWFLNDLLHRTDGPALTQPNGAEYWYLNDLLHRADGPALTHPSGTEYWYLNGKRHRADGPAVTLDDGAEYWYLNDQPIDDTAETLNALHIAGRIDELRLILEAWTPDGPTIDELAAAVEQTPT